MDARIKHFLKSKIKGEVGQKFVAEMFRSWNLTVDEVGDVYFPDYDLAVKGILHGRELNFKAEVKHDYRMHETGNFCLELDALRHSRAGILTIVEGVPPQIVYMLPLQDALRFAESYPNKRSVGERGEFAALVPKDIVISQLKPKVLTNSIG